MRYFLLILGIVISVTSLSAQDIGQHKYLVTFHAKCHEHAFDPQTFFHPNALQRRLREGLPLHDESDLPVCNHQTDPVEACGATIKMLSRWFNAAVVWATAEQINAISALPIVATVEQLEALELDIAASEALTTDDDDLELLDKQVQRMGSELIASEGLNGKGLRIAIFDVGFSGADRNPAFDHFRASNRVVQTWDFVKNRTDVYLGGSHGTSVWSCIGGKVDGKWSGLAWDAEFLLARTELAKREPFSEEENWVAAAEWADKHGADIINSSLGYTDKRYFPEQMNGKKSFISRGANMAARKGILVVNAAGNEGSGAWRIIGAPADADSVLTVGGVQPCCDYRIEFSSYGPTADKRLKPNVCAQGRVFCASESGNSSVDGTSFASPLMAGFAACMWQKHRSMKAMEVFKAIEKAGHLYPYFDYAHGYGIPHAERFNKQVEGPEYFKFERNVTGSEISIMLNDSIAETDSPQLLYYELVRSDGLLESYYTMQVTEQIPLRIETAMMGNTKLRVHYRGQTAEIQINP
jgi:hypothetical protein